MSNKYWENETPVEVKSKFQNLRFYKEAGILDITDYDESGTQVTNRTKIKNFVITRSVALLEAMLEKAKELAAARAA